jgi:hypothetical protein
MSSSYVGRSGAVAARAIDGQTVILQLATSALFTLNRVGSRIWELADGRTTVDQIARRIHEEFEVEAPMAALDAKEFVERLAAQGVLLLSDAPVNPDRHSGGEANATNPR